MTVNLCIPAHLEVVYHPRVPVLRGNMDRVVTATVRLVQPRAVAEQELGAWEGTTDTRPV